VAAVPSLAHRIVADVVVAAALASFGLAMVVLTRMTTMPPIPKPLISLMIPSFAMVSNQHLLVMPTKDFPIPPREVYCCHLVVAEHPYSTEEEENFDEVSSHPVVALESSSFVVEDTETCCTHYVEIGELRLQLWPVVPETAMVMVAHSP